MTSPLKSIKLSVKASIQQLEGSEEDVLQEKFVITVRRSEGAKWGVRRALAEFDKLRTFTLARLEALSQTNEEINLIYEKLYTLPFPSKKRKKHTPDERAAQLKAFMSQMVYDSRSVPTRKNEKLKKTLSLLTKMLVKFLKLEANPQSMSMPPTRRSDSSRSSRAQSIGRRASDTAPSRAKRESSNRKVDIKAQMLELREQSRVRLKKQMSVPIKPTPSKSKPSRKQMSVPDEKSLEEKTTITSEAERELGKVLDPTEVVLLMRFIDKLVRLAFMRKAGVYVITSDNTLEVDPERFYNEIIDTFPKIGTDKIKHLFYRRRAGEWSIPLRMYRYITKQWRVYEGEEEEADDDEEEDSDEYEYVESSRDAKPKPTFNTDIAEELEKMNAGGTATKGQMMQLRKQQIEEQRLVNLCYSSSDSSDSDSDLNELNDSISGSEGEGDPL